MINLIVYAGALAVLVVLAVSMLRLAQGSYHFLPTIGWSVLMTLPFLFEYSLFNSETRGIHAFAVLTITALMFGCDAFANRISPVGPPERSNLSICVAYALAGAYLVITIFHLATVPTIPLWLNLTEHPPRAIIDQARLEFSREYAFFPPLRYLFNLSTLLLGLPAVFLLWNQRHRLPALALAAWAFGYCVMGTAKGPFILALVITAASILHFTKEPVRKVIGKIYICAMIAGFIFVLALLTGPAEKGTIFSGLQEKFTGQQEIYKGYPYMIGDYTRSQMNLNTMPQDCLKASICRKVNYLAYRIMLTPIEVSARWYEYFHEYPVKQITIDRKIVDSRSGKLKHPALAVAEWAYITPFPREYTANLAYAYGSIDADAYARYGIPGLIVSFIILGLLRLGAVFFNDINAPTCGIYNLATVGALAVLPANASIQAILLPQGLGPIIAVLIFLYVWRRYRERQVGLRKTSV